MDQTDAIRDLQHMLRQLSRRHPTMPRPVENGIFDETTLEAVMIFQRDYAPPVTGTVDERTWDAIVDAYKLDQLFYGEPMSLRVLPDGEFSTPHGQQSSPMLIAQAVFTSLPASIANFRRHELHGLNTGFSHKNLRTVQRLANLTEDGILNRATWDFVSRLYHVFVTRQALEQLGL